MCPISWGTVCLYAPVLLLWPCRVEQLETKEQHHLGDADMGNFHECDSHWPSGWQQAWNAGQKERDWADGCVSWVFWDTSCNGFPVFPWYHAPRFSRSLSPLGPIFFRCHGSLQEYCCKMFGRGCSWVTGKNAWNAVALLPGYAGWHDGMKPSEKEVGDLRCAYFITSTFATSLFNYPTGTDNCFTWKETPKCRCTLSNSISENLLAKVHSVERLQV